MKYRFLKRGLSALLASLPLFAAFQSGAIIDSALQMQLGNPSGATADPANHQHYLVVRTVEAIDYNDTLGLPNWASWDLTAADLGSSGRSPDFLTDTGLPAGFYKVTTTDYSGAGYDRGHMCPSADRTDNDTDNALVFLMSNIIPQAPNVNSGVWSSFEGYCRSLAQSGNELLIICGPSGFDGSFIQPSQRVFIPGYSWKIVVVVPAGAGTALSRVTAATRVIALKIPNTFSTSGSWQSFVTSARQIEADTGFNFFTALPAAVAETLRDKVDGLSNPPPSVGGFAPATGTVGSAVTITGNGFTGASSVTFNGVSASFTVNSGAQLTTTVPRNATAGYLSVTTPNGTAITSSHFAVTGASPDLAVKVSHFGNFSQRDTGDSYTLVVTNLGTAASAGLVTVSESLPAGMTATSISGVGWNANLATLTCTRSNSLLAGAAYPPITVVVNVASNAAASVTNIVSVSGGGDGNPANNQSGDATTINPATLGGTPVTLLGWDTSSLPGGNGNYGPSPCAPTFVAPNLVAGGLTRGSGIGTSGSGAQRGWGGNAFTATDASGAIAAGDLITFTAASTSGNSVSYTAISKFDYRHSATGPAAGVLQYQIGGGPFVDVAALAYPDASSSGNSLSPINLTGVAALQNVGPGTNVTFRIVNYGGGSSGTWYIFDTANSTALDFVVQGYLSAPRTNFPDLVVSVSHAGNFRQGDTGDTYTLAVTNAGTAPSTGTVTLSALLPAGLTAVSLGGAGWNSDLGTLSSSRGENLSPGAGYPPVTLVVNVATNAAALLTNIVTVSGGGETNTANNMAKDPTAIVALTPVQHWRLRWFGNADSAGIGADDAVAGGDGWPNLVKYALGLDPFAPAHDPVSFSVSGGLLRVQAPRNPSATDVTLFAETADSLSSPWTTNGITIDPSAPSLFQAHRNLPAASAPGGFLRLRVKRP
jgi:endonuclease G